MIATHVQVLRSRLAAAERMLGEQTDAQARSAAAILRGCDAVLGEVLAEAAAMVRVIDGLLADREAR